MKKIILASSILMSALTINAQTRTGNTKEQPVSNNPQPAISTTPAEKPQQPASNAVTPAPSKSEHDVKQERPRPDASARAQRMTDKMTKELLLNDEQKQRVLAINLDKAKKMDALMVDNGKEKKAMGQKRKSVEAERDAELKTVLTPEQYEKYMKGKEERKEEMKEKREGQKELEHKNKEHKK